MLPTYQYWVRATLWRTHWIKIKRHNRLTAKNTQSLKDWVSTKKCLGCESEAFLFEVHEIKDSLRELLLTDSDFLQYVGFNLILREQELARLLIGTL